MRKLYTQYIHLGKRKHVTESLIMAKSSVVPGKRAYGQKLVPVPMSEQFIEHINAAVEKLNYGDRSKLIRDAIAEKLNREGIDTPKSLSAAPVRAGKMSRERANRKTK